MSLAVAVVTLSGCGDKKTTVTCEPACPVGTHCAASGCVVDQTTTDAAVAIPADLTAGCFPACGGDTPHCNAENLCVPCITDDHCPTGSICKPLGPTTVCVAGCKDDGRCGGGSQRCCDGQCTDQSSDPDNCGACGTACVAVHGAPACVAGSCTTGACAAGWKDCNASSQDGCEVNTSLDPQNCGSCGTACSIANSLPGCSGSCYIAACQFGWGDCDTEVSNGCELSLLADPHNCGGCGVSCPTVPHAKNECRNASCVLTACANGFADCDGAPGNGCETTSASDPANCGSCGNVCDKGLVCRNGACTCPQCNFPNAASRCINNVCAMGKCNAGFADCNADPKDGCEVDLTTDANNCSACGTICDPMTPACVDSQCVVGAPEWDFADYNGAGTMWDANKQWDGSVDCPNTCKFYGLVAVGVRFVCNLHGVGPTEGCDAMNDGDYGNANCDVWYDEGVRKLLRNNEDCAGGNLMSCIGGACREQVTYHAIQCQCKHM